MPFSLNDSSMPDLRKKKFNHRTLTSVYEQQQKNENEPIKWEESFRWYWRVDLKNAVLSDLGNLSYNGITGNGFEIFLNS